MMLGGRLVALALARDQGAARRPKREQRARGKGLVTAQQTARRQNRRAVCCIAVYRGSV